MKKLFILYDGRAKTSSTDDASVYVTATSEREAQLDGQDPMWQDGLWYEYDCISRELRNGKPRWDIAPNKANAAKCARCGYPQSDHPRTTCWGSEDRE